MSLWLGAGIGNIGANRRFPPGGGGEATYAGPGAATTGASGGATLPTTGGAVRYIKPAATGTGDGTSLANASALTALNARIVEAAAGKVYIIADAGSYTQTSSIAITAGNCSIEGVNADLTPADVTIIGSRTTWTLPVDPEETTDVRAFASSGNEVFRLGAGANTLRFARIGFQKTGLPFRVTAPISNLTIDGCDSYNTQRYLLASASGVATAPIVGLTARNAAVTGFSKHVVNLAYASSNILIEDNDFNSGRQDGDNFAIGITIAGTCSGITIQRNIIKNCHDGVLHDPVLDYWNADGISMEPDVNNVLILDNEISGCTDGGVDIKAANVTMRGNIISDNKRNLRLWGVRGGDIDIIAGNSSVAPNKRGGSGAPAHVHLAQYADVWLDAFTLTDTNAACVVYLNEEAGSILRRFTTTETTDGTREDFDAGSYIFDPVADTVAPIITSGFTGNVTEEGPWAGTTLTATDAHTVTWDTPSGADRARFAVTRGGALSSTVIPDYEFPEDANADGIYQVLVRARDERRNQASGTFQLTVVNAADVSLDRYIRTVAAGAANGSDWANAYALTALNTAAGQAAAVGGKVYIRADEGDYTITTTQATLTHGGALGDPLIIRGVAVDLTPMQVNIVGNRTAWTLPVDPEEVTYDTNTWTLGPAALGLGTGANYVRFEYFHFKRVGAGLNITQDILELEWDNISFYNVQRGLEAASLKSLSGGTFTNTIAVGYSKQLFRLRGDTHDIVIDGFNLNSGRQCDDLFAVGIQISETAHDILIKNGVVANSHDENLEVPGYWQGDGISSETNNYNITFEDVEVYGCTDGGVDLKSSGTTFLRINSHDNKYNYRLWGDGGNFVLTDCATGTPNNRAGDNGAAFDLASSSPLLVELNNMTIADTDPTNRVFFVQGNNVEITVTGYTINKDIDVDLLFEDGGFSGTALTFNPPLPGAVAFTVDWRVGFEDGHVPAATSVSTVLADITSTGAAAAFTLPVNTGSKLSVVGSTLVLAGAVGAGAQYAFTLRGTQDDGSSSGLSYTDISGLAFDAYNVEAVDYDGSSGLDKGGEIFAANGPLLEASVWFRIDGGDGTERMLFANGSNRIYVLVTDENKIRILLMTGTGDDILVQLVSDAVTLLAGTTWHHLHFKADLSGTPSFTATHYNQTTNTETDLGAAQTLVAGTIRLLFGNFFVAEFGTINRWNGALSELWVNDSAETVPADFRVAGKPKYLGGNGELVTGTAPRLYLNNPAATVHINKGVGGNFVNVDGTPTDASSSPSD